MQRRLFAATVLVLLLFAGAGKAQSPSHDEKPVWTMEFIKVKPGMFGPTLGFLDDDWMRVRAEAKHQGAVLNFHRIAEQGGPQSDGNIVLLTEYKSQAAYDSREKLFESIRRQLSETTSAVIRPHKAEELYDTVGTRVFQDFSQTDDARFRLLQSNRFSTGRVF